MDDSEMVACVILVKHKEVYIVPSGMGRTWSNAVSTAAVVVDIRVVGVVNSLTSAFPLENPLRDPPTGGDGCCGAYVHRA